MSQCMRFPIMWYVRPAKAQTSLRIRAVWSEPLLVAWIFYECKATNWTSFGFSKLKRGLHRLVLVYTCQNASLLEITCHGSIIFYCSLQLTQQWTMKMSSSSSMALLFFTAAMVVVLVSSYTIESYKTSKPIIWRPQGDCYKSIPDCRLKLCDKR